MAIPHVVAGNVARAAEQNTLIDAVNTNTNNVASNTTAINSNTSTITSQGNRITALEGKAVGTNAGAYFGQWSDAGGKVAGTKIENIAGEPAGGDPGATGVKIADLTTAIGTPTGCSMNAGTLTVTQAGLWQVQFSAQYTGSSAVRALFAGKGNATNFVAGASRYGLIAGPSMDAQSSSATLRLAANETVSLYGALWTDASVLNVWKDKGNMFTAIWLGP